MASSVIERKPSEKIETTTYTGLTYKQTNDFYIIEFDNVNLGTVSGSTWTEIGHTTRKPPCDLYFLVSNGVDLLRIYLSEQSSLLQIKSMNSAGSNVPSLACQLMFSLF